MDDISTICKQITSRILKNLEKEGYSSPCEWDINNGLCEEWALSFCEQVKNAIVVWLDLEEEDFIKVLQKTNSCLKGYDPETDYGHCVVLHENMLYDAQNPEGVHSWRQLNFVKGITKNEFLECKRIERKVMSNA